MPLTCVEMSWRYAFDVGTRYGSSPESNNEVKTSFDDILVPKTISIEVSGISHQIAPSHAIKESSSYPFGQSLLHG